MQKFLTDVKYIKQPEHKEVRFLENKENYKVLYALVGMPLMSDREAIFSVDILPEMAGKKRIIIKSVEHPDYPVKSNPVRMSFMKALELKQVGDDMELEEFSQMNLGGYFPMRLLNMAIGSLLGK